MDARLSPPSARRRGPWSVGPWILAIPGLLVAAGLLIQACSDNNGTTGPKFAGGPAASTGFANTAADIVVQVGINPNSITPGQRAGVTAFVTNKNGQPLAGKKVQFSTDVGSLDVTVGTTNAGGQFSTTIRISATDVANATGKTSATVTAFVEGAFGTGIVNFGGNAVLVLIPASDTQSIVATVDGPDADAIADTCPTVGGFTITYTVSGGVPPYVFSRGNEFGAGATLSPNGVFTVGVFGPLSAGESSAEVITVTDARGTTATATVKIECVAPA